jgi:hypothetical protein
MLWSFYLKSESENNKQNLKPVRRKVHLLKILNGYIMMHVEVVCLWLLVINNPAQLSQPVSHSRFIPCLFT